MISNLVRALTIGAIAVGAVTMAHAQQSGSEAQGIDVGKYEYDSHCAECHGARGKGDGPYLQLLRSDTVMPDLTELSKKNGGVFPFPRVYGTIAGSVKVRAHGPSGMPIWGRVYMLQSQNVNPLYDPQYFAIAKVLAVTEYVYRLQPK
jgi:mono/diheme cytochrome c family protein